MICLFKRLQVHLHCFRDSVIRLWLLGHSVYPAGTRSAGRIPPYLVARQRRAFAPEAAACAPVKAMHRTTSQRKRCRPLSNWNIPAERVRVPDSADPAAFRSVSTSCLQLLSPSGMSYPLKLHRTAIWYILNLPTRILRLKSTRILWPLNNIDHSLIKPIRSISIFSLALNMLVICSSNVKLFS